MAKVDLYNMSGAVTGSYELNDEIFGVEMNEHVVHMATVQYLANNRQGTKGSKTRAEVSGGGIKPRPQKGSGRSRQGSIRSPQWKGGGIVFAPKARDFSFKLNKKVKRLALKCVLSDKVANGQLVVVDSISLPEIKTKGMKKVVDNLKLKKALIVLDDNDQNVVISARNLPGIVTASYSTINVYDILKYDTFVVTKAAADKIQEVYA